MEAAINKAWADLDSRRRERSYKVRFVGEDHFVDINKKEVLDLSLKTKTKDYYALLILHYILNENKIASAQGEWISFRDLEGGEFYYPVFRKRAIEPVIKKFGDNISALYDNIGRLDGRKIERADAAVEIKVFEKITILILLWEQDEELPGDANILFRQNIKQVFGTEDIAVISEIVASKL